MSKRRASIPILLLLLFAIFIFGVFFHTSGKPTYYIGHNENPAERGVVISYGEDGYAGRFPDIIKTDDSFLVAYYWNKNHAPYMIGDSLGEIKLQRGTENGAKWDSEAVDLINMDFLIENGLGVWKKGNQYFYSQDEVESAGNEGAEFCIEARDPNLAKMGNYLVMTFFTRLPWDCNLDGHIYTRFEENFDYTYGRTYIMISEDEGITWSSPVEVQSSYLDLGCAKRGNVAVISEDTILIPLYGYSSEIDDDFTTSNVLASYENGEWIFKEEYSSHIENGAEIEGAFEKGVTEVSFTLMDGCIYALMRPTGDFLVSNDCGKSWDEVTCIGREDSFSLHQPGLLTVPESGQLVASWAEPNEVGGRDVYLMLYSPNEDAVWDYNVKECIYKNGEAGDMGDPTCILLDKNKLLTVYYDVQKNVVACIVTKLNEY